MRAPKWRPFSFPRIGGTLDTSVFEGNRLRECRYLLANFPCRRRQAARPNMGVRQDPTLFRCADGDCRNRSPPDLRSCSHLSAGRPSSPCLGMEAHPACLYLPHRMTKTIKLSRLQTDNLRRLCPVIPLRLALHRDLPMLNARPGTHWQVLVVCDLFAPPPLSSAGSVRRSAPWRWSPRQHRARTGSRISCPPPTPAR